MIDPAHVYIALLSIILVEMFAIAWLMDGPRRMRARIAVKREGFCPMCGENLYHRWQP